MKYFILFLLFTSAIFPQNKKVSENNEKSKTTSKISKKDIEKENKTKQKNPPRKYYFFENVDYGSKVFYNPFHIILNSGLDTTQIPGVFQINDINDQSQKTFHDLTHPISSWREEGHVLETAKSEFFGSHSPPNWGLHTFGNGMQYRVIEEWFYDQEIPRPYNNILAYVSIVILGFLNETVESFSRPPSDRIVDMYFFDQLGMLLFTFDFVPKYTKRYLDPALWHYQPVYSVLDNDMKNVGCNYSIRPAVFGKKVRPFLLFGITNIFGLSYALNREYSISVGLGPSIDMPIEYKTHLSYGIYIDKNNSLMSSIIINGSEDLLIRLNIYPGVVNMGKLKPFFYVGITNNYAVSLGFGFVKYLPLGLAPISN